MTQAGRVSQKSATTIVRMSGGRASVGCANDRRIIGSEIDIYRNGLMFEKTTWSVSPSVDSKTAPQVVNNF
jgi:hypothetical protein